MLHQRTFPSPKGEGFTDPLSGTLKPSATPSAVREAYRRKMREYHPDKVVNLGIELRDLAEAKAKEINRAYEEIKRARNL
jgi:DnaJ-class molecular chaperone